MNANDVMVSTDQLEQFADQLDRLARLVRGTPRPLRRAWLCRHLGASIALLASCPSCLAAPGEPCNGGYGPHRPRRAAAVGVDTYPVNIGDTDDTDGTNAAIRRVEAGRLARTALRRALGELEVDG